MDKRPWSVSVLKKLSKHIRDGTEPASDLPSYDDVMIWYDDLVEHVILEIDSMNWEDVLGERYGKPIGRAKTIQTLRQKLQRLENHHLATIQDVAGVRLELPISLTEQTAVAEAICHKFGQPATGSIDDLRETPHSGYRAVHVRLNLTEFSGRVEVQIRTKLQGVWANLYEELADLVGRDIRYQDRPEGDKVGEAARAMQRLSLEVMTDVEEAKDQIFLLKRMAERRRQPGVDAPLSEIEEQVRRTLAAVPTTLAEHEERTAAMEAELFEMVQSIRSEIRGVVAEALGGTHVRVHDPVQQEDARPTS